MDFMIPRHLTPQILTATPPQAGKTTLLNNLPNLGTVNYLNGDLQRDRARPQALQSAGETFSAAYPDCPIDVVCPSDRKRLWAE